MEREFMQTNTDYLDAVEFMKDFRRKELNIYGISDPTTVDQEIQKNVYQFTSTILQNKHNPAEVMYNLAKQYGFKPKTAEPKVENVFETVEKGQKQASKTLSGGGQAEMNLTAESLLELDGQEFEDAWKKIFGK